MAQNIPISKVTNLQTTLTDIVTDITALESTVFTNKPFGLWYIDTTHLLIATNVYTNVLFTFLQSSRNGGSTLWDNTNGRFNIPSTGLWHIDFSVAYTTATIATRMIFQIAINGTARVELQDYKNNTQMGANISADLLLNANDYVELRAFHNNTTATNLPTTGGTSFALRDRTASPCTYAILHFIG